MTENTGPVPNAKNARLVYVDALRGLAALIVLLHHTSKFFPDVYNRFAAVSPIAYRIVMFVLDRNHDAVMLFFVLSGFAIRLSTGRAGLVTASDVNLYFYRRFRRILPLFVAAIALTALLGALAGRLGEAAFSLRALLGNLLFLQTGVGSRGGWFVPYGENGPLWSLSYEMFYYLIYPPLVLALARLPVRGRLVSLAAVIGLSFAGLALYMAAPNPPAEFLSMLIIWYFGVDIAERYLSGARDNGPVAACLALGAVAVIAAAVYVPSATLQSYCVGLAIYGCLRIGFWLSSVVIFTAPSFLRLSFHTVAVLRSLGHISYAIYLFHYPLLSAGAAFFGQSPAVLAGVLLVTLALAWAAERWAAAARFDFMKLKYVGARGLKTVN